jgi:hypothetical protein
MAVGSVVEAGAGVVWAEAVPAVVRAARTMAPKKSFFISEITVK